MTRFGADPRAFFEGVYHDAAPWDIGAAQPDLVALMDELPAADPVLDVGCGSGDLSIALAARGHTVRGVDFAGTAIVQARVKAAAQAPDVAARLAFDVVDALHPARLGRFGAVVDSGFYHLFDEDQTAGFATELASALMPGGRYYLLAFATEFAMPNTPRKVMAAEIRQRFSPARGWRILDIRAATFHSRIAPVPAIAACMETIGADGQDAGH